MSRAAHIALAAALAALLAPGTGLAEDDDPALAGRIPVTGGAAKARPTGGEAEAGSDSEDIEDPDDDDGGQWAPSAGQKPSAQAPPAAGVAARPELLQWRARALVRLELDTDHSGPRSAAEAGVREDVMALVAETSLSLQVRPSKRLRLQAGGRLRLLLTARRPEDADEAYAVFNGDLHRADFEAFPGEMFVEVSSSWIDVQAGMLTTVWGANDLVNPNDVLTAMDLRLGLTDAELMRLPVLSLKADLYIKKVNVSLVWQPVATPHRVDLFGGDFAVLGAGAPTTLRLVGELAERMADDSVEGQWQTALVASSLPRPFADSSLALRVSGSVAGWDLAAHYAFGYERLPVLRLHADLVRRVLPYLLGPMPSSTKDLARSLAAAYAGAPPVESLYLRQHHVGLSFSRVIWRLVLDGDVAFISRRAEPLGGEGLPLQREGAVWSTSVDTPVVAYTLGLRYVMGEELQVKLEWWHELLLRPLGQEPDQRPDLLLGGPHRGGLALHCRYTIPKVDLTLQLTAHTELLSGSLIVAPRVEYRLGQHLALLAGATIFAGGSGPGALYNENDQLHVGLRGVL